MTALSIDGVSVSYGGRDVLNKIVMPLLEDGTVLGILGPNGAGKSTLLRALAGLQPYRGLVHLNGERIEQMPYLKRAGLIGYLPQTLPQATTLISYEAVVSACRAVRPDMRREEVERAVEAVFDQLGIRHLAFQALGKLSGGQRQMVGLAQVLVRGPKLLLLDEPTSALDLRWQLNVIGVISEIVRAKGGICLMALHDINLAMRHCNRLMVLSDAGVLAEGAPAEAITTETLHHAYGVRGRIETCSQGRPYLVTDEVSS
ncbi:MAG: ABC transporter ATP-binding protein [Rhodospirillales bacterium]|nr:ABC transporter ATP-binding protein [Rhodospirillales bacterium]